MKSGADFLVRALEEEGVEYVFGVPGEETLDILESLRQSRIRLVLTRHEQAAAFMAATVGRLTGRPGVCLATCGPGALNLTTAAAYASLGAMPMVMITGQKPLHNKPQAGFQVVDIVNVFRPLTKLSRQITDASEISAEVHEAFALAVHGRPGPILLEFPEDVAAEKCIESTRPARFPKLPRVADDRTLDYIATVISDAKRPLVMLGTVANHPNVSGSVTNLVKTLGLPFFTTQMGMGAAAGCESQCLGTAALTRGDYLHDAVSRADMIISIGHDIVEKPPYVQEKETQKLLHIGFVPTARADVYDPDYELSGDIALNLDGLVKRLKGVLQKDNQLLGLKEKVVFQTVGNHESKRWPPLPQQIVSDVRKVMPDDGIVALDNGMYKIWFSRNYSARQPNTLLLDNMLATMGAGLPSAISAALLYPERRVLAVCGDGGFMMNSQDMETAVRLGLNLVVLIIDDGAYGMIRWKQEAEGYPDFGMTFNNPDFVEYAKSYGAEGTEVKQEKGLAATLDEAFRRGGVQLVVVPVDYSENSAALNQASQEKAAELCSAS